MIFQNFESRNENHRKRKIHKYVSILLDTLLSLQDFLGFLEFLGILLFYNSLPFLEIQGPYKRHFLRKIFGSSVYKDPS